MKILYLASCAEMAGAETCLLRLVIQIVNTTNHNVSVLNTKEGILNEKLRSLGITVYVQPSIYVKKIYRLNEVFQLFKNIIAFKKIVKLESPDIIHAFTLPMARRVVLFRKIGIRTPIVGTIHDALTIEHFGLQKVKIFSRSINSNYQKLISVSEATKEVAIENGVNRNKIIVIHNGVPLVKNLLKTTKTESFVIANFGRIVFGKGQHVIIEAINILKNAIPELKCFIIGKPPIGLSGSLEYYESLKRKVFEYKIEKHIEFVEWIDGLSEYYRKLDVYVLSSVKHDPFPTVNLEAMQYKLPIIATNVGGSKEQILDGVTGFIIEPGNPELLAKKILFLYKNPDQARQMGENGFKRVTEEFTMQKYVTQHLSLYEECLHHANKI